MLVRFSLIAALTLSYRFPVCARRGSLVLDDQQLSGTKPKCSKTDALKGKTKSSSVEEHAQELNPVLKVSEIQSTERRVKQVQAAVSKSSFLSESDAVTVAQQKAQERLIERTTETSRPSPEHDDKTVARRRLLKSSLTVWEISSTEDHGPTLRRGSKQGQLICKKNFVLGNKLNRRFPSLRTEMTLMIIKRRKPTKEAIKAPAPWSQKDLNLPHILFHLAWELP
ncbi:hypothetical protein Vadar_001679 [Vaccinium darrowii]|uniref:Uncharacterized protein n=1 Tax=Vaccinium darrowii TaxID=229202 RepID=A0ACB7XW39_9ERIC|nr:hypothetical protein Vadar_001679 [Vaccinium darrowii]